jgi:hypothetical protein
VQYYTSCIHSANKDHELLKLKDSVTVWLNGAFKDIVQTGKQQQLTKAQLAHYLMTF